MSELLQSADGYWPFWLSGIALTVTMVTHWLISGRMMAVSGRFTALVNRFRYGDSPEDAAPDMSQEDLLAALQAATAAEFGEPTEQDSLDRDPIEDAQVEPFASIAEELGGELDNDANDLPAMSGPVGGGRRSLPFAIPHHFIFFGALIVGSAAAAALSGSFRPSGTLAGAGFDALVHGSPLVGPVVLVVGGMLVGFGTRMAGGCTSGHGLCGVSRFQPGSALATAAFFGMGIAVSLGLELL